MTTDGIEDIYVLSPMQQGMVFHTLYAPQAGLYHVQLGYAIDGPVDAVLFEQSWQLVLARHTILRTAIVTDGLDEPMQVVHRHVGVPLAYEDWRGVSTAEQQARLQAYLQADRQRGFELSQAPLMRLALFRRAEAQYHLLWSYHHVLLDGWSKSILFHEVAASYEALCRGQSPRLEPARPFRDYIAWQQQQAEAEAFWRATLNGFTTPTPLGLARPSRSASHRESGSNEVNLHLSRQETATLQAFARQHHVTLNTVVQGAWALLLSRYSGEDDVVYGSAISARPPAMPGIETMVGLFLSTVPIRVHVAPTQSVMAFLRQFQQQHVAVSPYAYSSLVQIQGWSDVPRRMALFDSVMVFENYPEDALRGAGGRFAISREWSWQRTNYPLTVVVVSGQELHLSMAFEPTYFETDDIKRMLQHLRAILAGMVRAPESCLGAVPLLTEAAWQEQVVVWNATAAPYPREHTVHTLVETQAARRPDAAAITYAGRWLTYAELNRRANGVAWSLQTLGVGPDVRVGLCVERSLEMVVGLLGILKAGGAYVPLDPMYPKARLAFMLEDARVSVLVTQERLRHGLPEHGAHVVCLDPESETAAPACEINPVRPVTAPNLAYVIYTSGSTGQPKGVQIPHQAVVNFLHTMRHQPGLTHEDTLLAVTSLSFDIAVLELILPLMVGARVVLAGPDVAADGAQLAESLETSGATVMQATPATWRLLLASGWQGRTPLRIFCGGEALTRDLADALRARGSSVWNLYGPTETTVWSTAAKVEAVPEAVSIGRPIANTQLYLLDAALQPVSVGLPGDVYLGGDGLARGYLNRPALTAERFIPNPFSETPGARLHTVGDVAHYRPDGALAFLGRRDQQVKLRGFRVELGEIEAVLGQHAGVQEAVVLVREDRPGDARLVAYIIPQQEAAPAFEELRRFVQQNLPDYMTPAAVVTLETWPLTPNGKVDRRALPAPDGMRPGLENAFVAPRSPIEELLASRWADVLGLERVGVHDNFFDLGGHSLLATQVMSRVHQVSQTELPLSNLFDTPTVAGLAACIEAARRDEQGQTGLTPRPIARQAQRHTAPLSFAQQRLWFLEQLASGSAAYNLFYALHLEGRLDVAALQQSVQDVLRRHDILRTTFSSRDGQPVQAIAPALTLPLPLVDLRVLPEAEREAEARRLAAETEQHAFDLAQGPLLHVTLLRLGEAEYVLLLAMHHIITDGWSMELFFRELSALYSAFAAG